MPASACIAADNTAKKVHVLAAASLTNVLNQLAHQFSQTTGITVVPVYGGSGSLAKQIEQGVAADMFVSADEKWMQYLIDKHLVQTQQVQPWLGNRLVMITPIQRAAVIVPHASTDIRPWLQGYWCTGDTDSVPVGIYAKQALMHLGWWPKIRPKLVSTQDVRAALTLVEREECDIGIVYATDALLSDKVRIAGQFAAEDHAPIVYPLASLPGASPVTQQWIRYLTSDAAKKILLQYGFQVLFK